MKKNRLPKDAVLANILLNPRGAAYRELCAICTDENGFQSDEAGATLRDEVKAIVVELLKGNFEPVTVKLNEHCSAVPTRFNVRPFSIIAKSKVASSLNARFTTIRLNSSYAWLIEEPPDTATPEQIIYRLLRETLENGKIERLALCKSGACQKLFFRKSLKGVFCSDHCRAMHFFYE